jgi:hypothetical protein
MNTNQIAATINNLQNQLNVLKASLVPSRVAKASRKKYVPTKRLVASKEPLVLEFITQHPEGVTCDQLREKVMGHVLAITQARDNLLAAKQITCTIRNNRKVWTIAYPDTQMGEIVREKAGKNNDPVFFWDVSNNSFSRVLKIVDDFAFLENGNNVYGGNQAPGYEVVTEEFMNAYINR